MSPSAYQVTNEHGDEIVAGSSKKRALDLNSPHGVESYLITGSDAKKKTKRITWSDSELRALRKGVAVHGRRCNKWACIKADPDLAAALSNRSNVDLKDKWRAVSAKE